MLQRRPSRPTPRPVQQADAVRELEERLFSLSASDDAAPSAPGPAAAGRPTAARRQLAKKGAARDVEERMVSLSASEDAGPAAPRSRAAEPARPAPPGRRRLLKKAAPRALGGGDSDVEDSDAGDTQDAVPPALEPEDMIASDSAPHACMRGVVSSSDEASDHDTAELGGGMTAKRRSRGSLGLAKRARRASAALEGGGEERQSSEPEAPMLPAASLLPAQDHADMDADAPSGVPVSERQLLNGGELPPEAEADAKEPGGGSSGGVARKRARSSKLPNKKMRPQATPPDPDLKLNPLVPAASDPESSMLGSGSDSPDTKPTGAASVGHPAAAPADASPSPAPLHAPRRAAGATLSDREDSGGGQSSHEVGAGDGVRLGQDDRGGQWDEAVSCAGSGVRLEGGSGGWLADGDESAIASSAAEGEAHALQDETGLDAAGVGRLLGMAGGVPASGATAGAAGGAAALEDETEQLLRELDAEAAAANSHGDENQAPPNTRGCAAFLLP